MPALFKRLMVKHYDPAYRLSVMRNFPDIDQSPVVEIHDVWPDALREVAKRLMRS